MSPRETTWFDAVKMVLEEAGTSMHYKDIAERIVSEGLRTSVGATPSNTVYSVLANNDIFEKVAMATFRIRGASDSIDSGDDANNYSDKPITALGMYWERDLVNWTRNPQILGTEQDGADPVDMAGQTGIYLLHDIRGVVYVGRAEKSSLGARLSAHTRDRLKTRWDRFSWFGFRAVSEKGKLGESPRDYDFQDVIAAMEAILIEALEPPQNRRAGDGIQGIEYIQAEDPEKAKARTLATLVNLVQGQK